MTGWSLRGVTEMSEILIFGGTTEGRLLAEFCAENGINAAVSVTTDYGAELLPRSRFIRELVGKLDVQEIKFLLKNDDYSVVIDATHPFARNISANLKAACSETGIRYIRLLREEDDAPCGKLFNSISEIVEYLNQNDKKALITTGGNSLAEYTKVRNFQTRLTVRILPADGAAERCAELGFQPQNVILEKGPFTISQNSAHIKQAGAEILVTKESGAAGGFPEKAQAALQCRIELVTLRRPPEQGHSLGQIKKYLETEKK